MLLKTIWDKVCSITFGKNRMEKPSTDTLDAVLINLTVLSSTASLSVSSTCRDYCNILARHGPRGQGAVPGGGAGEGYAGPQWRVLLLHHSHCQSDWCQRQWTHIPAPWVTYMTHNDANTRPPTHTHTHLGNQWKSTNCCRHRGHV